MNLTWGIEVMDKGLFVQEEKGEERRVHHEDRLVKEQKGSGRR